MLFNPKYGLYGTLILPSHKLMHMLAPFFIITTCLSLLIISFISMSTDIVAYRYFLYFLLLTLIYSCTSLIISFLKSDIKNHLLIMPKYFLMLQISIISAWIDYLKGKYSVTWIKAESTRDFGN